MYKAIVRVDGSNEIGMGHIFSELNIASKLQNFEVLFLSKYDEGIKKLKEFNYTVKRIPSNYDSSQELKFIKKVNDNYRADIIIADVLKDDYSDYCKKLSKISKTMIVDYFGGLEVYSDILLNWSIFEDDLIYNKQKSSTVYCLGQDYLLSKGGVGIYHDKKKEIKKEVRKVLITIGGSDRYNFTQRVVESLKNFKEVEFEIVIGSASKNKNDVLLALKENKLKYNLIENSNDLSELIYRSDVAISAGGLTCLELATIGTPFLGLGSAVWETKRLKKLEELGICKYIGNNQNFDEKNLYAEFSNLIHNFDIRNKMSINGKKFLDGKGVDRIIKVIGDVVKHEN